MDRAHIPEPPPTGQGVSVVDRAIRLPIPLSVCDALLKREEVGERKYGTRLRTRNGRDPVNDLRQEVLDGVNYATQAHMERTGGHQRRWWVLAVGLGWIAWAL